MKTMAGIFLAVFMLLFGAGVSMGMHHEIKIQEKEGVGKFFTDAEG